MVIDVEEDKEKAIETKDNRIILFFLVFSSFLYSPLVSSPLHKMIMMNNILKTMIATPGPHRRKSKAKKWLD